MDNRPIGIFDSGVGGLTVLKEMLKLLPNESYIYFGDTKRAPYGNKSNPTLKEFGIQIIIFLLKNNCKAIIIACNTISASVLLEIKNTFPDTKIFDVISPTIDYILKGNFNSVGVLATKATIKSKVHEIKVHDKNPNIKMHLKACPLFVNIIEEGMLENEIPYLIAKEYLKDFNTKNLDLLVLACTHYPLIKKDILKALDNKNIEIFDPSTETAFVTKKNINKTSLDKGFIKFYYSGDSDNFNNFIKDTLNINASGEIVNLGAY